MATDLTAHGYHAVNGEPVVAIMEATRDAGAAMVDTWRHLEPIVKALTAEVQRVVADRRHKFSVEEATTLLTKCASVVRNVGGAAQGMLKVSEGQARLAVLLSVGKPERKAPGQMTQAQLVGVVLETAKRLHESGKPCPTCGTVPAVEVTHEPA